MDEGDKTTDFTKPSGLLCFPTPRRVNWTKAIVDRAFLKDRNIISANLQRAAEDKLVEKAKYDELTCVMPDAPRSTFLMVFSPDGKKVASTHGNHNVYVTDATTGKHIQTLSGHPRTPWCIAFHPSSNQILASGCLGGQVRVWDLQGGSEVWTAESQTVIASLAFHPMDRLLVIATYNELHFWDWSQPKPFAKCSTKTEREKVRYVSFDRLGNKIITGIANPLPVQSQWDRTSSSVTATTTAPVTTVSVTTAAITTIASSDPPRRTTSWLTTTRGSTPTERERSMAFCYRNLMNQYNQLVRRYFNLSQSRGIPTIDRGTDPMDLFDQSQFELASPLFSRLRGADVDVESTSSGSGSEATTPVSSTTAPSGEAGPLLWSNRTLNPFVRVGQPDSTTPTYLLRRGVVSPREISRTSSTPGMVAVSSNPPATTAAENVNDAERTGTQQDNSGSSDNGPYSTGALRRLLRDIVGAVREQTNSTNPNSNNTPNDRHNSIRNDVFPPRSESPRTRSATNLRPRLIQEPSYRVRFISPIRSYVPPTDQTPRPGGLFVLSRHSNSPFLPRVPLRMEGPPVTVPPSEIPAIPSQASSFSPARRTTSDRAPLRASAAAAAAARTDSANMLFVSSTTNPLQSVASRPTQSASTSTSTSSETPSNNAAITFGRAGFLRDVIFYLRYWSLCRVLFELTPWDRGNILLSSEQDFEQVADLPSEESIETVRALFAPDFLTVANNLAEGISLHSSIQTPQPGPSSAPNHRYPQEQIDMLSSFIYCIIVRRFNNNQTLGNDSYLEDTMFNSLLVPSKRRATNQPGGNDYIHAKNALRILAREPSSSQGGNSASQEQLRLKIEDQFINRGTPNTQSGSSSPNSFFFRAYQVLADRISRQLDQTYNQLREPGSQPANQEPPVDPGASTSQGVRQPPPVDIWAVLTRLPKSAQIMPPQSVNNVTRTVYSNFVRVLNQQPFISDQTDLVPFPLTFEEHETMEEISREARGFGLSMRPEWTPSLIVSYRHNLLIIQLHVALTRILSSLHMYYSVRFLDAFNPAERALGMDLTNYSLDGSDRANAPIANQNSAATPQAPVQESEVGSTTTQAANSTRIKRQRSYLRYCPVTSVLQGPLNLGFLWQKRRRMQLNLPRPYPVPDHTFRRRCNRPVGNNQPAAVPASQSTPDNSRKGNQPNADAPTTRPSECQLHDVSTNLQCTCPRKIATPAQPRDAAEAGLSQNRMFNAASDGTPQSRPLTNPGPRRVTKGLVRQRSVRPTDEAAPHFPRRFARRPSASRPYHMTSLASDPTRRHNTSCRAYALFVRPCHLRRERPPVTRVGRFMRLLQGSPVEADRPTENDTLIAVRDSPPRNNADNGEEAPRNEEEPNFLSRFSSSFPNHIPYLHEVESPRDYSQDSPRDTPQDSLRENANDSSLPFPRGGLLYSSGSGSGLGGIQVRNITRNEPQEPPRSRSPPMEGFSRWRWYRPRFLHPRYHGPNPFDDHEGEINDGIHEGNGPHIPFYRALITSNSGSVYAFDPIVITEAPMTPHHRIQAWNFTKHEIPDISKREINGVVNECKIHNDASVDVSADGKLLVTLLPSGRHAVTTMLGIYSLEWATLGQLLYKTGFEQNAVSVSLSPTARHLLVGLASRPLAIRDRERPHMAHIFRLGGAHTMPPDSWHSGRGVLDLLRAFEQPRDMSLTSLNCIRWAPGPGYGFVYGTNTGQLKILR